MEKKFKIFQTKNYFIKYTDTFTEKVYQSGMCLCVNSNVDILFFHSCECMRIFECGSVSDSSSRKDFVLKISNVGKSFKMTNMPNHKID